MCVCWSIVTFGIPLPGKKKKKKKRNTKKLKNSLTISCRNWSHFACGSAGDFTHTRAILFLLDRVSCPALRPLLSYVHQMNDVLSLTVKTFHFVRAEAPIRSLSETSHLLLPRMCVKPAEQFEDSTKGVGTSV